MTAIAAAFAAAMAQGLEHGAPWPGAVAVSGGGNSVALMVLLTDWAARHGQTPPVILCVDHGLQAESAAVARRVVEMARQRGLAAHRLVWRGARPEADIEAEARRARYALLGRWCAKRRLRGLYLGHTIEDQAETFVLRLARGSGLDGLAAMRPLAPYPLPGFGSLRIVRPLLGFAREDLRDVLRREQVAWWEDPMNGDPRFARVRLRAAWPALAELGISAARVAAASRHLARARDALDEATDAFLATASRAEAERIVLDGRHFAAVAPEIGLRALARVLSQVSGAEYRPRFERLESLFAAIREGGPKTARTLHGCRIGRAPLAFGPQTLLVTAEAQRKRGG